MSPATVLAGEDGPFSTPHDYTLSPGEAWEPLSISAVFDGSAAAGAFLACCSFYSQDGRLLGRVFPAQLAAGDTAEVTYSPFALAPSASGAGGGSATLRLPLNLTNPGVSIDTGGSYPIVQTPSAGADFGFYLFSAAVESIVFGHVLVPPAYKSGGSLVLEYATPVATGNVVLAVGSKVVADGGSFNPIGFTVEANQTIAIAATWTRKSVTFALTPALLANRLVFVELLRRGNLGTDTLAGSLLLIGAWLELTIGT